MAKTVEKTKVKKERTLGGALGLAALTLLCPPAGAAVIISDFTKANKTKKSDDQRHAEIQTLIDLEKDKAKKVESTEEPKEEKKEES